MKAKSAKGEDEVDEARRQLRLLPLVLKCDHFLELQLKNKESEVERSQLEDLLSECNVQLGDGADQMVVFQQKKKKGKSLNVGLGCGHSVDVEAFNGLVMGPDPSSILQASRFRNLWGESNCQVRRFQDGSLREVVPIEGPFHALGPDGVADKADYPMDASDFVLHQWIHLIRAQCPEVVGFRVARPLARLPNLLKEVYDRAEQTRSLRAKTQEFIDLLMGLSSDKMPVRRAKARSGCMYGSHGHKRYLADTSVPQMQGELKEKASCIPARVTYLPVDIEITSKSFLRPDLYTRLSLYHLRQLSEALASEGLEDSALCGDTLVVPYKSTLYGIKVQEAKLAQDTEISLVALHELLQGIGTHRPSWWGSLSLVRHWVDSQSLADDFDDLAADLIMGVVYAGTAAGPGASKLIRLSGPPATVEAAFLRFLYLLSFADFESTLFFLSKEECTDVGSALADFSAKRHSMPAVCVVTPRDEKVPGVHMKSLDKQQLKRVVNAARRTLYNCLKGRHFEPSFEEAFTPPTPSGYDFHIRLKPFKSDPKTLTQVDKSRKDLPVMDFDAVEMYLEELRATYDAAVFQYSQTRHAVGVRVHDKTEIDAVIEDAKILGKGIVHEISVAGDLVTCLE